jgi:hypothetical protein
MIDLSLTEEFSSMDMLVKLYDLPASHETLSRIAAAGISIRRALPSYA